MWGQAIPFARHVTARQEDDLRACPAVFKVMLRWFGRVAVACRLRRQRKGLNKSKRSKDVLNVAHIRTALTKAGIIRCA